MELNREQVVNALEKWMKNYDGKVTNFVTLGNAVSLIEKLDDENERLKNVIAKYEDIVDKEHEHNQEMIGDLNEILGNIRYIKVDTVQKMRDKLTTMSEFYLHADRDGGLYYVDFCDWIDQVSKEILGEE